MKNYNAHIRVWALAIALFAALELALILFIDRPFSQFLRAVDTSDPAIINLFRAYTDLGLGKWYEWPTGIGAIVCLALSMAQIIPLKKRNILRREGRMLAFIFTCVTLAGLVTDALKPLIGRARPVLLDREDFYGFLPLSVHANYNSFPSGHTTTAFALAFALTALWPRSRSWMIAFAVAIALSRVMVNAHYVSDVFAGAAVGWLTGMLVQKMFVQQGWIANKG
jgi:membrane-associated phospholipid phosphatase